MKAYGKIWNGIGQCFMFMKENENSIRFSIIMPVYNEGYRLRKAIDSISRQSYPCYELVIINDGSTDTITLDVISEYEQKYAWIHVLHKANGGVSSARNLGISLSTGNYILFLDGDDYYKENALECFAKVLNSALGYGADLVLPNFTNVIEDKNEIVDRIFFYENRKYSDGDKNSLLDKMFYKSTYSGIMACYSRKSVIDYNMRYREDWLVCEDIDCFLKFFFQCKSVVTIMDSPYVYISFDKERTCRLDRYISQLSATSYWVDHLSKMQLEDTTRSILADSFIKTWVLYSLHIQEMNPADRDIAYKECDKEIELLNQSKSIMPRLVYVLAKLSNVRVAMSCAGGLYRLIRR